MLAPALWAVMSLVPLPAGTLAVDAYFDDWAGLPPLPLDRTVSGSLVGPDDLGGRVQLALQADRLFFALQIRDDVFQRGSLKGGDGVEILWRHPAGTSRFQVVLNELEGKPAEVRRDGRAERAATVASTLRKDGWAVELSLPLEAFPGIREGEGGLVVTVRDADGENGAAEAVLATGPLGRDGLPELATVALAAAEGIYDLYLRERGMPVRELARRKGHVAGDALPEEIVVNDVDLVVAGRGLPDGATYFYFTHGWGPAASVRRFDLQELDGRPGKEILVERVEPGEGMHTEILEIYGVEGGLLKRMFAQKLAEEFTARGASVRSRFKVLPPRGKGAARFEITVAEAHNVTAFDYPAEPPGQRSYHPLPLPWNETRSAVFALEDDFWQRQQ